MFNVTRHYQRKQKRIVYDNDLPDGEAATISGDAHSLDTSMAASALQEALGRLSEAHREVIVLRYYEW